MPFVRLQTNVPLDPGARGPLIARLSGELAGLLGKPEAYVMVSLEMGCDMAFAGSPEPLAYLEVKSLGLPGEETARYAAALCSLVFRELGVPAERVYIEFSAPERHLWGWNGGTFAR